jgi:hypothetical protein
VQTNGKKLPTSATAIQPSRNIFFVNDFFHTRKHKSKIYYELELEDTDFMSVLRCSHDKSKPNDPFLLIMSRFDQLAAMLGRQRYAPIKGRYNFQAQRQGQRLEDRRKLAREISQVVNEKSIYELYNYIYASEELDWLVESRDYGFRACGHICSLARI